MRRVTTLISLSLVCLIVPTFTAAQNAPSRRPPNPETQKCAAAQLPSPWRGRSEQILLNHAG